MMMFTEGLDESAVKWIKQGSDANRQQQQEEEKVALNVRSPLAERLSLDPHLPSSSPLCVFSNKINKNQVLPPLKFYATTTALLGTTTLALDDDTSDGEDHESVASAPEEEEEEAAFLESSNDITDAYDDNDEFFGFKSNVSHHQQQQQEEEEEASSRNTRQGCSIKSKENLRIQVNATRFTTTTPAPTSTSTRPSSHFLKSHASPMDEIMLQNLPDLGTPSAPPILVTGKEETSEQQSIDSSDLTQNVQTTETGATKSQCLNKLHARSISGEAEPHTISGQVSSMDQTTYYHTSCSGQNAWQTMVAYDACIRLCLHAWARGCTEAPEFLHDECFVLRCAFGLHKFLLQPRGINPCEGRSFDTAEETCTVKAKKVVGKIRVEVKKVRIIEKRKLKSTYSQRGALYVQAGTEYVRHVSTLVKNGINSLKITPFSVTSEESLSCLFQLKSSTKETDMEPSSAICLQPGTGDYHVFFPESQGDALLLEVQDLNRVTQGRATIQVSSLSDNPSDRVRWWPIYHEDHECVGKVQLFIGSTITSDETHPIKSGQVVETHAYDLVLESAMRAHHFHSRNLRLLGPWKWLLSEFADYYGVSDSYTKLRYLSYVMNVATPTMDCLETVYELLVPIVKVKNERNLTRQEKSILLDCETQVENLLAKVFENYKSLDELSPTGLTDLFGPIPESAAPALVPAVQVYALLHDILAPEAQTILRNYLQTAATKRCRRHMVETDEFMSSNSDGSLTDPMTTTTAYLKMKNLCANISNEIQMDIMIHNQHILPSSIDLSNIAAAVYSTELCKRLRGFLATWPPSSPLPHVTDLLIATADLERNLELWNIRPVSGGVDCRSLFHNYIMVWVEDRQLELLDLCKAEKVPWSGVTTNHSTSPFAENIYEKIKDTLHEYEVVISRWPQYSLFLENAVTNVERAIIKALEKQYSDILTPLKDSIPKKLGMRVQKLTRRQSIALYSIPFQLGVFLNTIKRILDALHCRVEDILKPWASCLPVMEDKKSVFGEQLNGITVLLRTKYKNYMLATVEKLVSNMQGNRSTRLKTILEETKEADGEAEIRERMHILTSQLLDLISNLHEVFSSRIFVAICRGFWDRMGQTVLKFLENRKENRVWYNGSYYALGILDDTFASQMQRLQGNALQEKDLEPPRSVVEARSILCRGDTQNNADPLNYLYI